MRLIGTVLAVLLFPVLVIAGVVWAIADEIRVWYIGVSRFDER